MKTRLLSRYLAFAGLIALSGCDIQGGQASAPNCFSVIPGSDVQPQSPIFVNGCTGQTWLLVKSRFGDKPEDPYTFQWLTIERLDFVNPKLANGRV
jgi:hypothetical protein